MTSFDDPDCSPSVDANHDSHVALHIGEASHPGPANPPGPAACHFDDPDADDGWLDNSPCDEPWGDDPPDEHAGWDDYGYLQEPGSDSEASTAAPPSDGAGCTDENVIPPWSIGLSDEAVNS